MSNPAVILNDEINVQFSAIISSYMAESGYLRKIISRVKDALMHSDPLYAYELLESMHSSRELESICSRYPVLRNITELYYNLLLEHFASEGLPEAKEKLACLYLTGGEGIEQSATRALELCSQSVTLQPSLLNAIPPLLKLHERYHSHQGNATDYYENEVIKGAFNEIDLAMLIENLGMLSQQLDHHFKNYPSGDRFFSDFTRDGSPVFRSKAARTFVEHMIYSSLEGIKNLDLTLTERLSAVLIVVNAIGTRDEQGRMIRRGRSHFILNGIYKVSTTFAPDSTERNALNILITRFYYRLPLMEANAADVGLAVARTTLEKYASIGRDCGTCDYPAYQQEYIRKTLVKAKLLSDTFSAQKLQLIKRVRGLEEDLGSLPVFQLLGQIVTLSSNNTLEDVLLSGVSGTAALEKRARMLSRIYKICLEAVNEQKNDRQENKLAFVRGILSALPLYEAFANYGLRLFLYSMFLMLCNGDLSDCVKQLSAEHLNDEQFHLANYYCRLILRNNHGNHNAEFYRFRKSFYRENTSLYNFCRYLYGSGLFKVCHFISRLPSDEILKLFACPKRKTEFMQFILSYVRSVSEHEEFHKTVLKKLLKALLKAGIPHDREVRYYVAAIKQSLNKSERKSVFNSDDKDGTEQIISGTDFLVCDYVQTLFGDFSVGYSDCMQLLSLYDGNEEKEKDAAYLLLNHFAENMRANPGNTTATLKYLGGQIIKKLNDVKFNAALAADYKFLIYRNNSASFSCFGSLSIECRQQKLEALVAHEFFNFTDVKWVELFRRNLSRKARRYYPQEKHDKKEVRYIKQGSDCRDGSRQSTHLTPVRICGRREFTRFLQDRFYAVINADRERIRKFGLPDFPESFIISGEPGTGKTYAVDYFARSTGWKIRRINFGSIGSSHIHETSKKIHEQFKQAKEEAPCIVIIDEADAILNDRADMDNSAEFKIEEVSAFLQELQSARDNQILVICMTNNLDEIDPAIKREGRLGAHFIFDYPDETDAAEIVEELTAKVPHEEFDYKLLGRAFAGLSMAKIASIINLAKHNAFLQESADIITQDQIMTALAQGQRLTVPDDSFRLPAHKEVEQFVNEEIIPFLRNIEVYRRFNVSFPSSMLLYGPPGTGKTDIVNRIADYLQWSIFRLDASTGFSEHIHGAARKINDVFRQARLEAPSIVLIDEADMFLPSRDSCSQYEVEHVNTLLSNISEAAKHNVMVIATTNRLENMDEACKRTGRFSRMFFIDYPKEDARIEMLREELETIPTAEDIDFHKVASHMTDYSASDVAFVVELACKLCCRNNECMVTERILHKAVNDFAKIKSAHRKRPISFFW